MDFNLEILISLDTYIKKYSYLGGSSLIQLKYSLEGKQLVLIIDY